MFRNMGKFTFILLVLAGSIWAEEMVLTGKPVALTEAGKTYMAPKWSPDGSHLAAVGANYSGIYVIDFKAKTITTLINEHGVGHAFSWSPDGKTIATNIYRYDGPWRLSQSVLLNMDGNRMNLNEESRQFQGYPKFSNSGDMILLKTKDGLNTYSLNTQQNVQLEKASATVQQETLSYQTLLSDVKQVLSQVEQQIVDVEVSPSETQIAYTTIGQNLWVIDIDGTNRRYLGNGTSPDWSFDSKWITCMITKDDGHVFTHSDIVVFDVNTGDLTKLTSTQNIHEMNPKWSPDGNWIAYDNALDGRIWAVQVGQR